MSDPQPQSNPNTDVYRNLIQQMWTDGRIVMDEVSQLVTAQATFGLSSEQAAAMEREVMGMTKEEALVSAMGTNAPAAPAAAPTAPTAPPFGSTLSGFQTGMGTPPPAPTFSPAAAGAAAAHGPGSVIKNRFEVVKILGEGGMGQVLQVKDNKLNGQVRALKMVRPEHSTREDLLERLKAEVVLCQQLRHEGIVQVFDYDTDDATGLVFFTMEYVDGITLRRWLASRRGDLPSLDEFQRLVSGLCDALSHAHDRGVIHLDLKPENLMVSPDLGQIRVMDFGISRAMDPDVMYQSTQSAGTPYYIAPEQERGEKDVDARADVYALGAILYEFLTGEAPRGRFRSPSELRQDVPESVSDAVVGAMSSRRDDRPADISTLRNVLSSWDNHASGAVDAPAAPSSHHDDHGVETETLAQILEAAEAGDADAQWRLGTCYLFANGVEQDDVESVNWFRKSAEQGNADGQWALGENYQFGDGVPEDKAAAVNWYRKSAEQGNAQGQCSLGRCYLNGSGVDEDDTTAVAWFRKSAEQGNAEAQWRLGACYFSGFGVAEDKAEAVAWFRKSAEQGDADAQWRLGLCYDYGTGVPEDEPKAVSWYRKAAEQGNADGQFGLGACYGRGAGIPRDDISAFVSYKKAAEQGHAEGQWRLGTMYEFGTGTNQDEAEAVAWYRKSAEQGNAEAQWRLGVMYDLGSGVAEDEAIAVSWYRKAAEQESAAGQWRLGVSYECGTGVPEDKAVAVNWYRKAAEQGDGNGQWRLGTMYLEGSGVAEDHAEAVNWFQRAAEQGFTDGQYWLGTCYELGAGVEQDRSKAAELYSDAADLNHEAAIEALNALSWDPWTIIKEEVERFLDDYDESFLAEEGLRGVFIDRSIGRANEPPIITDAQRKKLSAYRITDPLMIIETPTALGKTGKLKGATATILTSDSIVQLLDKRQFLRISYDNRNEVFHSAFGPTAGRFKGISGGFEILGNSVALSDRARLTAKVHWTDDPLDSESAAPTPTGPLVRMLQGLFRIPDSELTVGRSDF